MLTDINSCCIMQYGLVSFCALKETLMAKRINKTVKNAIGNKVVLKKGETLRNDGVLMYRYTDEDGKRHSIYAPTIEELRQKEEEINKDKIIGVKASKYYKTVDNAFEEWFELKRGIRSNTNANYLWMYSQYARNSIGRYKIKDIEYRDIRNLYNSLYDNQRLAISTIDSLQNVLRQVFDYAIRQHYITDNPCANAMVEMKKCHNIGGQKHKALTVEEQDRFLSFIYNHDVYNHWYPIFAFMVNTGLRVGEVTGLRWCDVNLHDKIIDVNHTLVYVTENSKSSFRINPPKTRAGKRTITMIPQVVEALEMQAAYLEAHNITCKAVVDGYGDFIFVNKECNVQHQGTLNKALARIIRDANVDALDRDDGTVLLPKFSCHNLRSTFCTRLAEAGVNIRVAMKLMGHGDMKTTLEVYTSVSKEWEKQELDRLNQIVPSPVPKELSDIPDVITS